MKNRIVLADDDQTILTLVSLRLEADKYQVYTALDGFDARRLIHRYLPHAAILDLHMPGTGGLALLDELKADPQFAAMPVMIVTGERNPETVMNVLAHGAADYMVKPFDPDVLAERVARMIRNSDIARAQSSAPASVVEI